MAGLFSSGEQDMLGNIVQQRQQDNQALGSGYGKYGGIVQAAGGLIDTGTDAMFGGKVGASDPRMQQMNDIKNIFSQVSLEVGNTTSPAFYEKLATEFANRGLAEQAGEANNEALRRKKAEFEMQPKADKPSDLKTLLKEQTQWEPGTPEHDYYKDQIKLLTKGKTEVGKAPTTRKFEKGSEVIYQEWDSEANNWVEYGRAPRSVGGQEPDSIQNLKFQAKLIGCDLNDPACYAQAEEKVINLKRADVPGGQILVNNVKVLNESLVTARGLVERVGKIDKAFEILGGADGKPITGSFSDARTGAVKLGELFGLSNSKAVQATEALKSNNMALAGELLASGMFGAGTGISDRDMETALQMAGADMALSYGGMIRILQNLREQAVGKINSYNTDVEAASDDVINRSGYKRERYKVKTPTSTASSKSTTVTSDKTINDLSDEELRALVKKALNKEKGK